MYTSGGGYPLAKHLSSTSCPSTTTTDLVELSEMIGGRRTIRGTSAVSLSVKEIKTCNAIILQYVSGYLFRIRDKGKKHHI